MWLQAEFYLLNDSHSEKNPRELEMQWKREGIAKEDVVLKICNLS